jgi:hypothetical protein
MMLLPIALAIIVTHPAGAVQCFAPGSPSEELAKATAVFSGRVIGHDYVVENTPSGETAQRLVANIAVVRVWKGNINPNVTIHTWEYLLPNGYVRIFGENFTFKDDEEYLVYAFGRSDHLWSDQCSRTRELSKANADLKELGESSWVISNSLCQETRLHSFSTVIASPYGANSSEIILRYLP